MLWETTGKARLAWLDFLFSDGNCEGEIDALPLSSPNPKLTFPYATAWAWVLLIASISFSTNLLSSGSPSGREVLMICEPWPCFRKTEVRALKWDFLWKVGMISLGEIDFMDGSDWRCLCVSNIGFSFVVLLKLRPFEIDLSTVSSGKISCFLRYI